MTSYLLNHRLCIIYILNYSMCFVRVQFTLEKIGRAEATEYDSELENLLEQTDMIKTSTERILNCVELILQPNPGTVLTISI